MCDSRVRLPESFQSSGLMCGAVASGGFSADFLPLPRPPGPQGFLLRSVARLPRPCLLSTTRESVSLCPLPASGFPYRVGFSVMSLAASHVRAGGSPWVRRTASPDAVRLHIGSVHRISGLALSRLLDLLPNAIERFAVRYVPGFYLILPLDLPFLTVPLSYWCGSSVR